jgi:hypothetical protein
MVIIVITLIIAIIVITAIIIDLADTIKETITATKITIINKERLGAPTRPPGRYLRGLAAIRGKKSYPARTHLEWDHRADTMQNSLLDT